MNNETKATPSRGKKRRSWKERFIEHIRAGWSVARAAQGAGITRQHAYRVRDQDEKFAQAWDDAEEDAIDIIEDIVIGHIKRGTKRPVFFQGRKCGEITEYDTTLTLAWLKARRPERWNLAVTAFDSERLAKALEAARESNAPLSN